jgi:hypothetical protein
MAPGRAATRHEVLYRALVLLYPRSFREGYGDPMAQLFADRVRDVGAKAWLRALPDLVRTVPVERIEAVMSRLGPRARVLALAFAVLGAAAVTVGVGAGAVPIIAVAVVGVLVSQRRLFASLGGERAPLRHALVQAWWAPVAGLLGVAMILAGVGTIFEAHNLGGRIAGSGLLLAFGAGMLFGLMRRPFARMPGNALILLTTVPAMAMFWMIAPPLAAIAIWIGVLGSGFEEPAVA